MKKLEPMETIKVLIKFLIHNFSGKMYCVQLHVIVLLIQMDIHTNMQNKKRQGVQVQYDDD